MSCSSTVTHNLDLIAPHPLLHSMWRAGRLNQVHLQMFYKADLKKKFYSMKLAFVCVWWQLKCQEHWINVTRHSYSHILHLVSFYGDYWFIRAVLWDLLPAKTRRFRGWILDGIQTPCLTIEAIYTYSVTHGSDPSFCCYPVREGPRFNSQVWLQYYGFQLFET